MFDVERMLHFETSFYESFSSKVITDYGVLFYNPRNHESYDSNHAHIFRLNPSVNEAIQEIVRFYRAHNLTPRVYPAFLPNELDLLRPALEAQGFTVELQPNIFMRFMADAPLQFDPSADVRRLSRLSQEIIDLIHTDEDGDWTVNVLHEHVQDDHLHLLGFYDQNRCVAIASVKLMDGYSRVDDVKTHADFRGRHFGTRLMRYLVNYTKRTLKFPP